MKAFYNRLIKLDHQVKNPLEPVLQLPLKIENSILKKIIYLLDEYHNSTECIDSYYLIHEKYRFIDISS